MRRGAGNHAAENTLSGSVSNGATWSVNYILRNYNGDNVTGYSADTFQWQFRTSEENDAADLTLSTTAGTLSVSETDGVTTVTVNAAQSVIAGMCGDYVSDLVSKDSVTGNLTHHGHGIITFNNSPIEF